MLFAVDVGNTNITCGIFDGETLAATIRLTTKIPRTSDEYGIFLLDALSAKGIKKEQMEAVIISSVVPQVMYSLNSAFIKYFDITPMVVGAGMKTGIRLIQQIQGKLVQTVLQMLSGLMNFMEDL